MVAGVWDPTAITEEAIEVAVSALPPVALPHHWSVAQQSWSNP